MRLAKWFLLIVVFLFLTGCNSRPQIDYYYDARTDLCFAFDGRTGDFDSLVNVQCTDKVKNAAAQDSSKQYRNDD